MNFKVSERLLGQQVVDMCDLIDEKILENTSERTIIEQGLSKTGGKTPCASWGMKAVSHTNRNH